MQKLLYFCGYLLIGLGFGLGIVFAGDKGSSPNFYGLIIFVIVEALGSILLYTSRQFGLKGRICRKLRRADQRDMDR